MPARGASERVDHTQTERIADGRPEPGAAAPHSRRRPRLWGGIAVVILAVVFTAIGYVWFALQSEPEFYRLSRAALVDPMVRERQAAAFSDRAEKLEAAVKADDAWRMEFTQAQINAWLLQELPRRREPEFRAIREPLVDLEAGLVRAGAQLDSDSYEGFASIEFVPRIEHGALLVLEIRGLRAGDLPLPLDPWLDRARRKLSRVRWPVSIATDSKPQVIVDLAQLGGVWSRLNITSVEIGDGVLTLRGNAGPSTAGEPVAGAAE